MFDWSRSASEREDEEVITASWAAGGAPGTPAPVMLAVVVLMVAVAFTPDEWLGDGTCEVPLN